MPETVYLNGQFLPLAQARISPLDRGFLFADGVYEVIPCYSGRPFRADAHLQRLNQSLDAIGMPPPLSLTHWHHVINNLLMHNKAQIENIGGHCAIYLQVTRGEAPVRDHAYPADITPTLLALCQPLPVPDLSNLDAIEGARVITLGDLRWQRCDIKSIALLANVMARQAARDADCQEALFVRDGFITEGSSSNVFIVRDEQLFTPPESQWILGGITRSIALEIAEREHIPFTETMLTREDLHHADEVWLTVSTRGIVPVISLDGQSVGNGRPGPLWRKMAALYERYRQTLIDG